MSYLLVKKVLVFISEATTEGVKKVSLKISQISEENTCVGVLFW